jgi:arabinogalactan endo-1,4-beta-galactosidase
MTNSTSKSKTGFNRRSFFTRTTGIVTATSLAPLFALNAGNSSEAFAAALPDTSIQAGFQKPPRGMVLGHDLSIAQQLEGAGKTFSDHGHVQPVEHIVAAHGASHVRLRLWVNPPIPYNDLPHVLSMAKRIRAAGLSFLLDLHYSDFWADPGKQNTPQSWQGQDLPTLTTSVYNYTLNVLQQLDRQGTRPDIVQVGNEVTDGMLWPLGQIYVNGAQNWADFTTLLNAGIKGVRDAQAFGKQSRVMVHIDRGGDNGGSRWFYDHIQPYNVNFDLIGLSYYPWWHGPLSAMQANLNDLATRYQKDIVLVETAYPWTFADGDNYANSVTASTPLQTSYPATPAGQLGYMQNLLSILTQVPGSHGLGVVYWEPDWIPGAGWEPGAGDAWDNMTLFDWKGQTLPSIACYE